MDPRDLDDPRELFPFADPDDPAEVAKVQKRLAEFRRDLEGYYANKGKKGHFYNRGFVGQTKEVIRCCERWLELVEAR